MLSFFLAFSSHWVCPIASWRQHCVFVYVTFVEFGVISRLSCSPGVSNRAGNTGNAREFFLDFLAFFVDITFGEFWVDYFSGSFWSRISADFCRSSFRRGGSWDRPDPPASWALQPMLTRGHLHPCELGTYTHAVR